MSKNSYLVHQLRPLFLPLVLFGLVTNLSVLVSPLFMMHVLDRVVPSGNLNTLALLGMIAAVALIATAFVEVFRDRVLGRSADWLERVLAKKVFQSARSPDPADTLRDIAVLRDFVGGRGAKTLLDVPWVPLFLLALFLIHPAFFGLSVVAALCFVLVTRGEASLADQEDLRATSARESGHSALTNLYQTGASGTLMGVRTNLANRYLDSLDAAAPYQDRSGDIHNAFGSLSQFFRSGIQIGSLALGAFLVTQGTLSAGGMIGASIILGKTNAIIEGMIGLAGSLGRTRSADVRLSELMSSPNKRTETADLTGELSAVNLTIPRGGGAPPRIERVSFRLAPGECLAILGDSGSGKTSLLEALAAIAPAPIGNCFLDETDVRTLGSNTRDTAIGFVPQTGLVYPGTIAQNIACFEVKPDDEKVLAAARMAGIHGLISALPNAYETDLGQEPFRLSNGQKQRVAFARALYQSPKYLFLDEPNALLDHHGERQMADAIHRLKKTDTTIIMTVHRMGIANLADKVLVMDAGRMVEFGDRAKVLGRLANGHRQLRLPISGGALQDLRDWVARQFVRDGDESFKNIAETVATELYIFARDNGPDAGDRFLFFEFKFLDDENCSITLTEPRQTQLEAKVDKVREVVELSLPQVSQLGTDEQSLATVIQLSEQFEHRSDEETSAFFARITHGSPAEARVN